MTSLAATGRDVLQKTSQPYTDDSDICLERQLGAQYPLYAIAIERYDTRDRHITINDLVRVNGRNNLEQAIMMRILTPRGELASLGHPEYGSNLHQLMGRHNTDTTRSLLRLHIIESLKIEPRISEISAVQIESDPINQTRVNVTLKIISNGENEAVIIGPFVLEFEP